MKALLLTHIYPSLREPARGPYNHNIFRSLSRHCETRVIAPEPWWSRLRRPADLLRAPRESHTGIDTTFPAYWSLPRLTALHARGMYYSLRPNVARLRRDFPFDAIFAAWAYPDSVAASLLARDFDCPFIVKILGSDINELARYPAIRKQIKGGLAQAYRIITVSAALRERVIEIGINPDRVIVQHNGVNGERFAIRDREAARTRLDVAQDRPLICYVGRLGHEKGVDVLIEAMEHLRGAGRTDVDLALVGGGEMETTLRTRVAELGLQAQVRFCGMRPHEEVPQWISASDVLVLPSRREGCPNAVLEALASGRPVVASRVGGVPELLEEGKNGLMAPSENPQALAAGLQSALSRTWDPQALRDTVKFLSWDAVADSYYRILADSIAERRAAKNGVLVL